MDILELVHENQDAIIRPFTCALDPPRCNKSFARRSDLVRHERIHRNERPFQCAHCGKAFIQRSALTVHIRVHTGERPHVCLVEGCQKAFADSSSLARHRRVHTGKRPYKCAADGCSKTFCRKTTLTKHVKRNHITGSFSPYDHSSAGSHRNLSFQESSHHEVGIEQAPAYYWANGKTSIAHDSPPSDSYTSPPATASSADSCQLQNPDGYNVSFSVSPTPWGTTAHLRERANPSDPTDPHETRGLYASPIYAPKACLVTTPLQHLENMSHHWQFPTRRVASSKLTSGDYPSQVIIDRRSVSSGPQPSLHGIPYNGPHYIEPVWNFPSLQSTPSPATSTTGSEPPPIKTEEFCVEPAIAVEHRAQYPGYSRDNNPSISCDPRADKKCRGNEETSPYSKLSLPPSSMGPSDAQLGLVLPTHISPLTNLSPCENRRFSQLAPRHSIVPVSPEVAPFHPAWIFNGTHQYPPVATIHPLGSRADSQGVQVNPATFSQLSYGAPIAP